MKKNNSIKIGFIAAMIYCFLSVSISKANGATYYIDPTCSYNGNGTGQTCASGAGQLGAFNTWSTVTWSAGNTYSQKGGTTFKGMITVGASGTSANPITINSYGEGKANLNGSVTISPASWSGPDANGWYNTAIIGYPPYSSVLLTEDDVFLKYGSASGNFYTSGGNSYYKPTSGVPADHVVAKHLYYGIVLGMNDYITVDNLNISYFNYGISAISTMTSNIIDLASDASDSTKVSSAAHPFTASDVGKYLDIYHSHGNSGAGWRHTYYLIQSVDGSHVATLDKSCGGTSLTNGYATLGSAQAPNNITVKNSSFSDMMFGIWLDTYNDTSSNGVFTDNTFEYIRMSFEAQIFGDCKGGRGTFDNYDVSKNKITHGNEVRGATYSWELVNTSNWDEEGIGVQALTNSNFHHNTISGGDIRGFVLFVCASCDFSGNKIYANYVDVNRESIMFNPDESDVMDETNYENSPAANVSDNQIYYNILKTAGVGYNAAIYAGNIPTPVPLYNKIYNNTLIANGNGIFFSPRADYYEIKNNIIYNGKNYQIYIPGSPANMTVDYNLYKPSVAWTSLYYGGASKAYTTVWKALGFDVNSGPVADPFFVNSITGDYSLTASSPAINAGVDVGLTSDFAGNSIIGAPDIGAYEYQNTTSSVYNITNFITLISNWLKTGTPSDLNVDNIVNTKDLGIMMSKWQ